MNVSVQIIADWFHTRGRPNVPERTHSQFHSCPCEIKAVDLINTLAMHGIVLTAEPAVEGPPLTSATQKPSDLVEIGCTQCYASVTLPPVLDAAASVTIAEGQMRVSIPELRGWKFTMGTGWLCPEHVPVAGGTNPPEGVKGEPDPPSDVRRF